MITKKSINGLIKKLQLPERSEFSQDWEYEVSNSERLEEFLEYYQNEDMDEDEKFTLMVIILESCNDSYEKLNKDLWDKIEKILIKDKDIHKSTIDYWSCSDEEDMENCFYITPLIRNINKKLI